MTEPEDLIQLHPALKSQWSAIAEHYARIGLSHSHNVIWDVSFDVLAKYPDTEISVFIFGDTVSKDSRDQKWFEQADPNWLNVVEFINSKNNFISLAQKLGVKIPQTLCFENKSEIDYAQLPLPCYVKPAVSVDGVGISRCDSQQQLRQALESFDDTTPLQIQEEIIASSFLNLQYRVLGGKVERLAATEQVLDGYAHSGNRYPAAHQPWESIEPMAEWMGKQGMKDIFAFDVAVVDKSSDTQYFAIECNPRFNGASYPTGIAKKLNLPQWVSETFTTKHRSLDEIDLSEIEFDAKSGTGAILVNWGSVLVGKISVLLAGSLEKQAELKAELKQRL